MQHAQLEQALRNFSQVATLLSNEPRLQVWSFEFGGHKYFLRLHEPVRSKFKRIIFGNPAHREFFYLQRLQILKIPAVRAIALLPGFRIGEKMGDAVLVGPVEGTERLDQHLRRLESESPTSINPNVIGKEIRSVLREFGHAKLGHRDLSMASFMIRDGKVLFYDVLGMHAGFLRKVEVMRLAHSARRFLTRGEIWRAWQELGSGGVPPKRNTASGANHRRIAWTCVRGNEFVSRIRHGTWKGVFTTSFDRTLRYASASRLRITEQQWQEALPALIAGIDAGNFETLKSDASGVVAATECQIGGERVQIVVKRPRRRTLLRMLIDPLRRTRARRTWIKAWKMLARDIPSEFPLLMIERHRFGVPIEGIVVFQRVDGERLDKIDLNSLPATRRYDMFFRLGRVLRLIERSGFSHMDAKSTNWIIHHDDHLAEMPVMLDLDSVRHYPARGYGLRRLLRAMLEHPQYGPEDSLAICRGYSPWARVVTEPKPSQTDAVGNDQ